MRQRQSRLCGVANAMTCTGLPPAAAAASARARWLGQLDLQQTAVELMAVEAGDRLAGLLGRGHLDEAEAARLACVTIGHDGGGFDGADLAEQVSQGVCRRRERDAADEEFMSHGALLRISRSVGTGPGTRK